MHAFYSDCFSLPLPAGHRFPMEKYALLRAEVLAAGVVEPECLAVPPPATDAEILRVHQPSYLRRVVRGELAASEVRRLGFPWSAAMVERSRRSAGGTVAASRRALVEGCAVNLAGGTHHAFADHGEGYCLFNDAAIAARAMQDDGRLERLLIIDCDVHQGNGTAAIFADDPSVFTLSLHGRHNFPFHKEQSDLDLAFEDAAGDAAYLGALGPALDQALARSEPQLAIYVSGADPHENDRLGRLALTSAGLEQRDRLVFESCRRAGVPIAVVMAGGYGRQVAETVAIHRRTVAEARRCWESWRRSPAPGGEAARGVGSGLASSPHHPERRTGWET
jgi:acetoin utilization deacetylase AcuC-like enzyme